MQKNPILILTIALEYTPQAPSFIVDDADFLIQMEELKQEKEKNI